MSKKKVGLLVLIVIILVIVASVYFYNARQEPGTFFVTGDVLDCSTDSFVVSRRTTSNDDPQKYFVFTVDENTVVSDSDGNTIAFHDIQPGMYVSVAYQGYSSSNSPRTRPTDITPTEIQVFF